MQLSVLIPTHQPRADYLARTLDALRAQTLDPARWELLLIDNACRPPLSPSLVDWHPRGRVVSAPELGLVQARIAGTRAAVAEVLVWSDDDNLLAPDYLARVLDRFTTSPTRGALGGRSLPEYENIPPPWFDPGLAPLGCRDHGARPLEARWSTGEPHVYPPFAPIGAGLAIRRDALLPWCRTALDDPARSRLGRRGEALSSGEDNDINLTLLAAGWTLAYDPFLELTHLIPARRLCPEYLARLSRAAYRDFVRVLALHGLAPWPPLSPAAAVLRRARAWFRARAWTGPAAAIRWQAACGQIDGRVALRVRPLPPA
jgi:glycosyltransferase involved in cell wall biosynthesis